MLAKKLLSFLLGAALVGVWWIASAVEPHMSIGNRGVFWLLAAVITFFAAIPCVSTVIAHWDD